MRTVRAIPSMLATAAIMLSGPEAFAQLAVQAAVNPLSGTTSAVENAPLVTLGSPGFKDETAALTLVPGGADERPRLEKGIPIGHHHPATHAGIIGSPLASDELSGIRQRKRRKDEPAAGTGQKPTPNGNDQRTFKTTTPC